MSRALVLALIVFEMGRVLVAQTPLGTAFTYQGRLMDGGTPANGAYDLQFELYDAFSAGNTIGSTLTQTNVNVAGGVFTVLIDFGASAFNGNARWLQIGVRSGGSADPFIPLSPRQVVSPVPNALYAINASNTGQLGGQLPTFYLDLASHTGTLDVVRGGTGATSGPVARSNLGAAASGANSDITSLSGLTTPLSVAQGGTGANSIAGSAFQARISGNCTAGTTIQTINADGTVVCSTESLRPGFVLTSLNSAVNPSTETSITIGSDGLGLISHMARVSASSVLSIAHCDNPECTSASITGLDSVPGGRSNSITIGTDGFGLITYQSNSGAKIAHCENVLCSTATITTLGLPTVANIMHTITIGSDGLGIILYTGGTISVAHCADVPCTSATMTTLSTNGVNPGAGSIVIGTDGLPVLAYTQSNGQLIFHCDSFDCSQKTQIGLISLGFFVSMAIGIDGAPIITYVDTPLSAPANIKVAHCSNSTVCLPVTTTTLDTTDFETNPDNSWTTSVVIADDGFPTISYIRYATKNSSGEIKVVHCTTLACTSSVPTTINTIPLMNAMGWHSSMTIGNDGRPLIAYWVPVAGVPANTVLKVAHCGNTYCSPFAVRRR
jgi:hypothetical protein